MNFRPKNTTVQSIQHPPRGPHNNFQRSQVFLGPRSDEFSRQVYNQQQTSHWSHYQNPNVRHLPNSGLQQPTNNAPHDMNKQTSLPPQQQTPGLYGAAPPTAVVSGPGGQQMPGATQAQVPGQSQTPPNIPLQSQGQQPMVGRNQSGMQPVYSYSSRQPPRPPLNTIPRSMNPTMALSSHQSPAAQFPQYCPGYAPNQLPPPHIQVHAAPTMMMSGVSGFAQRPPYQSSPMPSSQQVYPGGGTFAFGYSVPPPTQVYYPHFPIPLQTQGRTNMNQMSQGGILSEHRKTVKKLICIQDPNTMEDVTNDIISNANASSTTPPIEHSSNFKGTSSPDPLIAAQFAAQVARAATSAVGSKTNLTLSPVTAIPLQETPMMDYQEHTEIPGLDSSSSNNANNNTSNVGLDNNTDDASLPPPVCTELICEATAEPLQLQPPPPTPLHETFEADPLPLSEVADDTDGFKAGDASMESDALPGKVECLEMMSEVYGADIPEEVPEVNGPADLVDKPEAVSDVQLVESNEVCATSAVLDDSKSLPKALETPEVVALTAATSDVPDASDATTPVSRTEVKGSAKPPSQKHSLEKEAEAIAPDFSKVAPEEAKVVVELKKEHQQQNGEVGSSKAVSSREPEGKDQKRKGKKREKELNRKGDSKEGGEMDAFVGEKETIENVVPPPPSISPVVPPPSKSPSPVNVVTTVVAQDEAEKDAIEEEERRVARKNEENARVSQEALKSTMVEEEATPPLIEPPKPQITLPYEYKEDQWSPLNTEGKKRYDREFLLKLKSQPMSIRRPEGLPKLDIMKSSRNVSSMPDIKSSPRVPVSRDTFMPAYVMPSMPRQSPGANIKRASQPGRERKKIPSTLSQEVRLHHSENAWKPMVKAPVDNEEELKTQELYKKVRGVLNKLTPQKFQTLVNQIQELPINTEDRLKGVIDLVFEKAVDEPNFSVSYANMCKQLATLKVPVQSGKEDEYVNFRKLLLNKCQREFEKDTNEEIKWEERLKLIESADTEEKRKQLMEELEDEKRRARRRSTGNIRFIGELFKLHMLIPAIMHDCINKLLKQGDEESLECLCRLLMTVGKDLDMPDDKKSINSQLIMDQYFKSMETVVKMKQTSSRVRFMLQDVIELRQNRWVPRRDENNPKTIDQIHKEAQKEAQEQHIMLQHMPPPSKRSDDRRKGRGNVGLHGSDDGWQASKSSMKMKSTNYMPQVVSLSQPLEPEALNLGPQWKAWSSGAKSSSSSDSKQSQGNRFLVLSESNSQTDSRRGYQRSAASSRDSSRGRSGQYPLIRKTPSQGGPSAEREQAVNAVKTFVGYSASEQKPPPSKESIPSRPSLNKERENILKGSSDISPEERERKANRIIDEFIHSMDFKEAITCVEEVASPSTISDIVSDIINHVLERSSQARNLVGMLMAELVLQKVVTVDQYIAGIKMILEITDDLAIDIPDLWVYLGQIISPMILKNAIKLTEIKSASQHCIESGTGGVFMKEILRAAVKTMGSAKVAELWKASGIQWNEILSPKEDVDAFLKKELDFLVSPEPVATKPPSAIETLKKELYNLMANQGTEVNNDEIMAWIEKNISDTHDFTFIRALVTAVAEWAILQKGPDRLEVDKSRLSARSALLQRYLDHQDRLEVQALYALQALVTRLEHPSGMLISLLNQLYDDDILSDDAFLQWEYSDDPAEQEGRGVALKSVTSFFNWLKEADATDD